MLKADKSDLVERKELGVSHKLRRDKDSCVNAIFTKHRNSKMQVICISVIEG